MLCKYCTTSQITPEDFVYKSATHQYLKVKDEKSIHFLHINPCITSSDNTNDIQPPVTHTLTEQPKPSALDTNIYAHIKQDSIDNEKSSSDPDFDSFSKLTESTKFKPKKINSLTFLNGYDSLGFSIAYRNKIKLDSKSSDNSLSLSTLKQELPVIFFIHGVGGNSLVWRNQLNYFGQLGYEIIAIDLIGHGESTQSPNLGHYEFLEMSLDVLTVFDVYAKSDNIVIGHSYGCSFSVYLSQRRKNLISKVILISGGSPYPLIDNSVEAFKIPARSLFYTMKGQYWRPPINGHQRTIKQNILLIEGEKDKLVPLDDAFDMIRSVKQSYLVVVKDGSHMVILEKPDLINRLMHLFINDDFT